MFQKNSEQRTRFHRIFLAVLIMFAADLAAARTIVVTHSGRLVSELGASTQEVQDLFNALSSFDILDLAGQPSVVSLFLGWDLAISSGSPQAISEAANHVLLGDSGRDGIQDVLVGLLANPVYTDVLLVGDDRVIPMARIPDGTLLFSESTYSAGTIGMSTVEESLRYGVYLSDDPLALRVPVEVYELGTDLLLLPQAAVGRIVGSVPEMRAVVQNHLQNPGPFEINEVLVTGYDFLNDTAVKIDEDWNHLASTGLQVDALLDSSWNAADLTWELQDHADVVALSGHARHDKEGVPGVFPWDDEGLAASAILGDPLIDLTGSVLHAVGCHGGLSIPDPVPMDPAALDLPQVYLAKNAAAYVANSGYGWGLEVGIGYSERIQELFTEELSAGGFISVGEAVRRTKLRYFLEEARVDPYALKTLMQWTLYGFSQTRFIASAISTERPFACPAPSAAEVHGSTTSIGDFDIGRSLEGALCSIPGPPACPGPGGSDPPGITLQTLNVQMNQAHQRRCRSDGGIVPDGVSCAAFCSGTCFITVNDRERAGTAAMPLLPSVAFDTRIAECSQRGALLRGGVFEINEDFLFDYGIPHSNTQPQNGTVPLPQPVLPNTKSKRTSGGAAAAFGESGPGCDTSGELASVVFPTVAADDPSGPDSRALIFSDLEIDVFCADENAIDDLIEPTISMIGDSLVSTGTISWTVDVSDASGVWEVSILYTDDLFAGSTSGELQSLQLTLTSGTSVSGTWEGSVSFPECHPVVYFVQAVDLAGNAVVRQIETLDVSGLVSQPEPFYGFACGSPPIFEDGFESGDLSAWSLSVP